MKAISILLRKVALTAVVGAASHAPAQSQSGQADYPSHPIKFVVCCAGVVDALARAMGEEMAATLGQPFVVDTRPGQSGNIAANYVAKSKPDGYTIFLGTNSSHAANQSLYKNLPFDPNKDFIPLSGIAEAIIVLVTRPESKINSVADLIATAKARPDNLTYGWASSSVRMAMELTKQMTGVKIRDVPYKSNPQATTDLLGGQVDVMFADMTTAVPLIKAGKLKALAVSGSKRGASLPDVPTMSEAGLPGSRLTGWIAAWLPAKTPQPIVDKLQKAMHASLATPRVKQVIDVISAEVMPYTSSELMAFQLTEQQKWAQMIKAAGIEPE